MSTLETVRAAYDEMFDIALSGDAICVTTTCMYPSNGLVNVYVRGGANSFVVSDDGGAFCEIEHAGIDVLKIAATPKAIIERQGLSLVGGTIVSPMVGREGLAVAISLVANASKEVADWLFEHMKIPRTRDFKKMLKAFLVETFTERAVVAESFVGSSNKTHKFECVILLPNGKRLIVDPVHNERASINARVVANMDVRGAHHEGLEQRIVYDDDDVWHPEDLNLLGVGATVIPFSRSRDVLPRFAHAAQ